MREDTPGTKYRVSSSRLSRTLFSLTKNVVALEDRHAVYHVSFDVQCEFLDNFIFDSNGLDFFVVRVQFFDEDEYRASRVLYLALDLACTGA